MKTKSEKEQQLEDHLLRVAIAVSVSFGLIHVEKIYASFENGATRFLVHESSNIIQIKIGFKI